MGHLSWQMTAGWLALVLMISVAGSSTDGAARKLGGHSESRRHLQQATSTIPASPYADPKVCLTNGVSVDVNNYPSSPFLPDVFKKDFKNPQKAVPAPGITSCDNFTNCMDAYELNIMQVDLDLGAGCTGNTTLLAYNGLVPGPTFTCTVGRQLLVRHNNLIPANSAAFPPFEPCNTTPGRKGRPLSPHNHGSPSLAPWDGYAENKICSGESKDLVYPCNRPAPQWYHDHALDITSFNVYYGLAGNFFVREQPERWGLEGMETLELILQDKVFNKQCQFLYDQKGPHKNNLYGDINFVSGTPLPVMTLEPKWHRLSLLNGAASRPYLVSIVDAADPNRLIDVSSRICQVISGDAGYRRTPINFPSGKGLFMGVGERYEIVCDFNSTGIPGNAFYLWNTFDGDRMKDVPFFCYSHLLAKIVVKASCNRTLANNCDLQFKPPATPEPTDLDSVLSQQVLDQAQRLADAGKCTRTFDFGRSDGQWVINGQTWQSFRIAADDVGVNSWELWCFKGHGGWFHPIHVHLVEFYILKRYPAGSYQKLEEYESLVPKDIVELHPGAEVAVLMRWGPHRGEYMFHCHNIVHEDFAMMRTAKGNVTDPKAKRPVDEPFVQLTKLEFNRSSTGILYDKYSDPLLYNETAVPITPTTPKDLQSKVDFYVKTLQPYRIFYPGNDDRGLLCNKTTNPWLVRPSASCKGIL